MNTLIKTLFLLFEKETVKKERAERLIKRCTGWRSTLKYDSYVARLYTCGSAEFNRVLAYLQKFA